MKSSTVMDVTLAFSWLLHYSTGNILRAEFHLVIMSPDSRIVTGPEQH